MSQTSLPASLLLSLLLASHAVGDTLRIPWRDAPAHAVAHNPELAAARLRIEEARARLLQSGRPANPEIELDLARNVRAPESSIGVAFTQKFPVTARLLLDKKLHAHLLAQAEAEVREAERKLTLEVSAAVVRLLALDKLADLRDAQTALGRETAKTLANRAEAGEISPLESAQVSLESQQIALEGRKLAVEKISLLAEISLLIGAPGATELDVTGSLPDVGNLPNAGPAPQRPDLLAAKSAEAAAAAETELARASRWEDISAGLVIQRERAEDAPDGFASDTFVGLRLSIALPLWNDQRGLIAEKEAASQRAALETRALENRIGSEARAARADMGQQAALLAETRETLLPAIRQNLQTLETAYAKGEADLLALLRAREQRFAAETIALEALRDYHLARVRLEAATASHNPSAK